MTESKLETLKDLTQYLQAYFGSQNYEMKINLSEFNTFLDFNFVKDLEGEMDIEHINSAQKMSKKMKTLGLLAKPPKISGIENGIKISILTQLSLDDLNLKNSTFKTFRRLVSKIFSYSQGQSFGMLVIGSESLEELEFHFNREIFGDYPPILIEYAKEIPKRLSNLHLTANQPKINGIRNGINIKILAKLKLEEIILAERLK